jgi:hypothetical protein
MPAFEIVRIGLRARNFSLQGVIKKTVIWSLFGETFSKKGVFSPQTDTLGEFLCEKSTARMEKP